MAKKLSEIVDSKLTKNWITHRLSKTWLFRNPFEFRQEASNCAECVVSDTFIGISRQGTKRREYAIGHFLEKKILLRGS